MEHLKFANLAANVVKAKRKEDNAKKERIEAEEKIIAYCGFAVPEGSKSYKFAKGTVSANVTFTQPVRSTVCPKTWRTILKNLPENHPGRNAIKIKYDLDLKASRLLNDTQYRAIATAITRKPGKISVKIKSVNDGKGCVV